MNELKKTMIFGGVALVLAILAFATTPSRVTPEAFQDQGELFFPEFQDPNSATSLEVIDYNEETGEAIPFKVVFEGGRWTIPSHYDYPADGKERLAKTAAGVIGIRKDDFRTDNPADHPACGVIDPLDETATSLTGRGKRVTIKGPGDEMLADFIIGKEVEDRDGMRFVRVPGQKRVYAVRMDIDISTKFSDWIEADLLKAEKDNIDRLVLSDYSVNERTGVVNQRDVLTLTKEDNTWEANRMSANQEVNTTKMNELLRTLDDLKIVGVRPKPEGLSASLKKAEGAVEISQSTMRSLQSKGYFFSRDGALLSNEGEMQVETTEGVVYTLRFGEIAYGSGTEVSAGIGEAEARNDQAAENRYLFISARFDGSDFTEPPQPANTDFLNKADSLWSDADRRNKEVYDAHEAWRRKVEKGQELAHDLNARFADWYYVISDDSFKKLRLTRSDLLKNKQAS